MKFVIDSYRGQYLGADSTTARPALPWVEGSEQRATWHHVDGVVKRQEGGYEVEDGRPEATERDPFRIPRRLKTQQGTQGPPQSFAGGLGTRRCPHAQALKPHFGRVDTRVTVLKCRLCPSAAFSNWEDFKRHCKYMGQPF
ncbi:hypothetical protein BC826DRAFT_712480 [Russula brevipes]|nr:hypothetical protein BC826DRAFT_712480 [Russula brevipes]